MARNDLCFCGSGKKQKKCHPDINEESYFAHIISLNQQIDKAIEASTQFDKIKCQKGCGECCYQNFTISSPEFYYLMYNVMENQGEKAVQEYINKGYDYWMEYAEEFPESAEALKTNITNKPLISSLEFFLDFEKTSPSFNRFPCVFLDLESQSCKGYNYRPHICREFGVAYKKRLNLPQAYCSKTLDGQDYQLYMADISKLEPEINKTSSFISQKHGTALDRSYPIFYYCKINYDNLDNLKAKIQEFKNYTMDYCAERKISRALTN